MPDHDSYFALTSTAEVTGTELCNRSKCKRNVLESKVKARQKVRRQSKSKHTGADNKQIPAKENRLETQRVKRTSRSFIVSARFAQSGGALVNPRAQKINATVKSGKKSDGRGKRLPFESLFISRLETGQPGKKLRRAVRRRGKRKDGWSQGKASTIIPRSWISFLSFSLCSSPFIRDRPARSVVAV